MITWPVISIAAPANIFPCPVSARIQTAHVTAALHEQQTPNEVLGCACRKTGIQPQPPCSVIPLGTGNGMSVNLGWGHRASRRWVKDRHSMADVRLLCLLHLPIMACAYHARAYHACAYHNAPANHVFACHACAN